MSTAIKHKKRSRRAWQKNEVTRNAIFSRMDQRAYLAIQAKLMKQTEGGI